MPCSLEPLGHGELWLHEIKHDGFRVIARRDSDSVRLYSRPGNDLTKRFPLIVESLARLRPRSCVIDGEAVACGDDGIASFDRIPPNTPSFIARFPLAAQPAGGACRWN
jgi:ATP-dependent DNA ligase